jgi:type VI secretion system protein ImpC
MEEVAAIKDIGNYFDRAEYIKWKSFRDTDDARYIGLVMPRVLGRLPYGPDTVPVRSFNYVEQVKGPDHEIPVDQRLVLLRVQHGEKLYQ